MSTTIIHEFDPLKDISIDDEQDLTFFGRRKYESDHDQSENKSKLIDLSVDGSFSPSPSVYKSKNNDVLDGLDQSDDSIKLNMNDTKNGNESDYEELLKTPKPVDLSMKMTPTPESERSLNMVNENSSLKNDVIKRESLKNSINSPCSHKSNDGNQTLDLNAAINAEASFDLLNNEISFLSISDKSSPIVTRTSQSQSQLKNIELKDDNDDVRVPQFEQPNDKMIPAVKASQHNISLPRPSTSRFQPLEASQLQSNRRMSALPSLNQTKLSNTNKNPDTNLNSNESTAKRRVSALPSLNHPKPSSANSSVNSNRSHTNRRMSALPTLNPNKTSVSETNSQLNRKTLLKRPQSYLHNLRPESQIIKKRVSTSPKMSNVRRSSLLPPMNQKQQQPIKSRLSVGVSNPPPRRIRQSVGGPSPSNVNSVSSNIKTDNLINTNVRRKSVASGNVSLNTSVNSHPKVSNENANKGVFTSSKHMDIERTSAIKSSTLTTKPTTTSTSTITKPTPTLITKPIIHSATTMKPNSAIRNVSSMSRPSSISENKLTSTGRPSFTNTNAETKANRGIADIRERLQKLNEKNKSML